MQAPTRTTARTRHRRLRGPSRGPHEPAPTAAPSQRRARDSAAPISIASSRRPSRSRASTSSGAGREVDIVELRAAASSETSSDSSATASSGCPSDSSTSPTACATQTSPTWMSRAAQSDCASAACARHASARPARESSRARPGERHRELGRLPGLGREADRLGEVRLGPRPRRSRRRLVDRHMEEHGGQCADARGAADLVDECTQPRAARGIAQEQRGEQQPRQAARIAASDPDPSRAAAPQHGCRPHRRARRASAPCPSPSAREHARAAP